MSVAPASPPVALVTGGARRLGAAIALALARRGADIALSYRESKEEALAVRAQVEAMGGRCRIFQADLAQPADCRRLIEETLCEMGALSILINNASLFYATPLESVTPEDFQRLFAINTVAPFLLAQAAAPHLTCADGVIINLLDEGALRPWGSHFPYIASKAALAALTISLAKALAPRVRVNGIAPGPILLPEGSSEKESQASASSVLLERLGDPEAIARAAAFLVFDANYTTGEILHVDGGRRWKGGGGAKRL